MMFEKIINLLNDKGVVLEKGLTSEEFLKAEDIYKIKFPDSLKKFLKTALPISNGFYNWRDLSDSNISYIKNVMEKPIKDIYEMAGEVYWCDEWGKEPENKDRIANEVRKRLTNAPCLIPIYSHRYIPMGLNENPPVISVNNIDVVYYGKDLEDYFENEFINGKRNSFLLAEVSNIPFWSEIM